MNKMESLFQEQRRNLLMSMVYAKQGLPPNINKEAMKQPLKEQNNAAVYKQPKRNQETTKQRSNVEKKKSKSSYDVHDVSF